MKKIKWLCSILFVVFSMFIVFYDDINAAELSQETKISEVFPDPNYAQAIAEMLNKNKDDLINQTELDGLGTIEYGSFIVIKINGKGIVDFTGTEYLRKATFVELNDNKIADLTPMKNIDTNMFLYLENNLVSDISPILQLDPNHRIVVYLTANQIIDFSPLSIIAENNFFRVPMDNFYADNQQISYEIPAQGTISLKVPVVPDYLTEETSQFVTYKEIDKMIYDISNDGAYDENSNTVTWNNIKSTDTELVYYFNDFCYRGTGKYNYCSGKITYNLIPAKYDLKANDFSEKVKNASSIDLDKAIALAKATTNNNNLPVDMNDSINVNQKQLLAIQQATKAGKYPLTFIVGTEKVEIIVTLTAETLSTTPEEKAITTTNKDSKLPQTGNYSLFIALGLIVVTISSSIVSLNINYKRNSL
ncbi:hypothetical protein LJB88_00560 [Erysipelotrichaceae bacterium OttesenSCG-928-M19]|nr:hypothetical protein [Erysipelotrichaceae bacterium OttesenSCG-928-M19]